MRPPLRAQDPNVAKQSKPDKPVKREDDEEVASLNEWRRRWREIMLRSVIYFDEVPNDHIQKLKPLIEILNTKIQPFYNHQVTHVVGNNLTGDLASKARRLGCKVYSVDKMHRFLCSVLGVSPNKTGNLDATHTAKLTDMLERDSKMNGQSASAKRENFHSFKGLYVMVWDPTQTHRPLCIKEWSADGEQDWPQLNKLPIGVCPFLPKRYVKPLKRKSVQPKEIVNQPVHVDQSKVQNTTTTDSNSSLKKRKLRPEEDKENEDVGNRRNSFQPPVIDPYQTRAPSQPRATLNQTQNQTQTQSTQQSQTTQTTNQAQPINSVRLREFGEIAASGVQRYSQTSTKSFLSIGGETVQSREIAKLRRKVMPNPQAVTQPAPAAKAPKTKPTKKPGFCENCLVKYTDLQEHLNGYNHSRFAENDRRFTKLDSLLNMLQRERP